MDCYWAPFEVYGKAEIILQRLKVGAALRPDGLSSAAPDLKVPSFSDVELDFQRSVQAVLRELNTPNPALQSNQGKSWSRKQPLLIPQPLSRPSISVSGIPGRDKPCVLR
jgi:hypothetical protein